MIIRIWTATTVPEREAAYLDAVRGRVLPSLRQVPGYRGAQFLRRRVNGQHEFTVLTRWASMEAVRELAGPDPTRAFVPPEIAATLERFDEVAEHFELVIEDPEHAN